MSLLAALLLAFNALFLASPASAEDLDSPCDQYGYDKFDSASGSETLEWGTMSWGGADGTDANELAYDILPGWTVDFCIKAGNVDNTFSGFLTGSGSIFHDNPDISHVGYKAEEVPPTEVTPGEPTFTDPTCEDPEAGLTLPDGPEGVTYGIVGDQAPGGTVTVTATADDGYVFPEGATTEWEHTYDEVPTDCETEQVCPEGTDNAGDPYEDIAECDEPDEPQQPEEPTTGVEPDVVVRPAVSFTDPDCDNPDAADVTVTEVDGIEYAISGDVEPGGTVTVTATATEGHRIARGAQTTWTHEFPELDCDVEVLPNVVEKPQAAPAPAAQLAATGMDSTELLLLALLLMGLGAAALMAPQSRREF